MHHSRGCGASFRRKISGSSQRLLSVVVEKYFVTEDNQKVIIILENISIKEMDGTVRF